MICPKCANAKTKVVATITSTSTQRWRKCPKCGACFVTVELIRADDSYKEYVKEILKDVAK